MPRLRSGLSFGRSDCPGVKGPLIQAVYLLPRALPLQVGRDPSPRQDIPNAAGGGSFFAAERASPAT